MENTIRISDNQGAISEDREASSNLFESAYGRDNELNSRPLEERARELIATKSDMTKFSKALKQASKQSYEEIESNEISDTVKYNSAKTFGFLNGMVELGVHSSEFFSDSMASMHNSLNRMLTGKDSVAFNHIAEMEAQARQVNGSDLAGKNGAYKHLVKRELSFSMENLGYNSPVTQNLLERVKLLDGAQSPAINRPRQSRQPGSTGYNTNNKGNFTYLKQARPAI